MVICSNLQLAAALVLPCVVACTPAFDDRSSEISGPRVLAVKATPAEALPATPISYRILVVDENGTVSKPHVAWSYCTQPKPTNELNDVASACFSGGDIVVPLGGGSAPTGTLPVNACAQFGPNVPQPASSGTVTSSSGSALNQTQGRPTDADSTGGYYQPVILEVTTDQTTIATLAETRVTCGLAGSTTEQFIAYNAGTHTNENPKLLSVTSPTLNGAPLSADDAAEAQPVTPSQTLTLRASWPACPTTPQCGDGICSPGEVIQDCPDDCTTPKGCGGSEPFSYLDPEDHTLRSRHESMRVSWFATAGSFDTDHTGRLEEEFAQTTSDDTWTAPSLTGPVFIWVVLRDDRGGVDWQSFRVDVR